MRLALRALAALPMARPLCAMALPAILPVAVTLPLAPAAARQALAAAIEQLPDRHPRRRRYRLAVLFESPLFPPDHLLRAAPGQPEDASLAIWLALPRDQRRHDVLLMPDEDYYWRDGGTGGTATGEYAAQFIVHMEGAAGGTALSIVQVHARRRHGKTFLLLGRAGPGFYWDIRPALPSPASAAVLADDLALWLGATHRHA